MNVQDLLAFATVAKLESLSRSSVELCVAQSALTRRMQRLETAAGHKLLERHARGVRPTEAGLALLAEAKKLQDEIARIEKRLMGWHKPIAQELRLAMPHGAMNLLGCAIVERFRTLSPHARLHLFEQESTHNREITLKGDVDLSLVYESEPSAELLVTPLLAERLLLMGRLQKGRKHSPRARPLNVHDLARLPLILPGPKHAYRRIVERIVRRSGVEPNVILEVHGLAAMTTLVQNGAGFAISTFAQMQSAIERGLIIATPIDSPDCEVVLSIVQRHDKGSSEALTLLRRAIQEVASHLNAPLHCRVFASADAMPK